MAFAIRWSLRAAERFEEAVAYLGRQSANSGDRFIEEVSTTLESAADFPWSNPAIDHSLIDYRKANISRVGYWVIYRIDDDAIVVVTIWCAKREPESWRDDLC